MFFFPSAEQKRIHIVYTILFIHIMKVNMVQNNTGSSDCFQCVEKQNIETFLIIIIIIIIQVWH